MTEHIYTSREFVPSKRMLRKLWILAMWECLRQGKLKYAWEAHQNSRSPSPPNRWSTGIRIFGPPEA